MASTESRRICFVTGTRAEFGLMQPTLRAIQTHPALDLQLVVTGIHLDPAHGQTIDQIRREGWAVDATVPWKPAKNDLTVLAQQTGLATAGLAAAYAKLNSDIVLVVGDRVEAFAAATAAHLSGKILAHVHGGDRALGQVDDALRHTITKLAHLHLPATSESADRIAKLGEDPWRIHQVGSPGIDGITTDAWSLERCLELLSNQVAHPFRDGGSIRVSQTQPLKRPRQKIAPTENTLRRHRYALLVLHPTAPDDDAEFDRANLLLRQIQAAGFERTVVLYPNNDPGAPGILRAWQAAESSAGDGRSAIFIKNLPRPAFLGLMRDAAVLVGNSSSGIIEAASFGTPVVDVGPRQAGRQRGENVTTVPFRQAPIRAALNQIWNAARPRRFPMKNPYGQGNTAKRIAQILATTTLSLRLRQKLIAY